jgi:hypothetical protein
MNGLWNRSNSFLAPKPSTIPASEALVIRTQNAPYAYHGLDQLVKKDPPTLETTNQKQWDSWVSKIENLFLVMNAIVLRTSM